MAAVSDSSPLIFYARIGRLDLLRSLFTEVMIPPAVWREVVDRSGSVEVLQADWIHLHSLPRGGIPPFLATLHPGEQEAIALASSLQRSIPVLLDDRRARRTAHEFGLTVVGSGARSPNERR